MGLWLGSQFEKAKAPLRPGQSQGFRAKPGPNNTSPKGGGRPKSAWKSGSGIVPLSPSTQHHLPVHVVHAHCCQPGNQACCVSSAKRFKLPQAPAMRICDAHWQYFSCAHCACQVFHYIVKRRRYTLHLVQATCPCCCFLLQSLKMDVGQGGRSLTWSGHPVPCCQLVMV
jgi:hypothetical protein